MIAPTGSAQKSALRGPRPLDVAGLRGTTPFRESPRERNQASSEECSRWIARRSARRGGRGRVPLAAMRSPATSALHDSYVAKAIVTAGDLGQSKAVVRAGANRSRLGAGYGGGADSGERASESEGSAPESGFCRAAWRRGLSNDEMNAPIDGKITPPNRTAIPKITSAVPPVITFRDLRIQSTMNPPTPTPMAHLPATCVLTTSSRGPATRKKISKPENSIAPATKSLSPARSSRWFERAFKHKSSEMRSTRTIDSTARAAGGVRDPLPSPRSTTSATKITGIAVATVDV